MIMQVQDHETIFYQYIIQYQYQYHHHFHFSFQTKMQVKVLTCGKSKCLQNAISEMKKQVGSYDLGGYYPMVNLTESDNLKDELSDAVLDIPCNTLVMRATSPAGLLKA